MNEEETILLKKKDTRIYFSQANKEVLGELRQLLQESGIHCGKVCEPHVKNGTKTKMHGLIVHGSKEVLKFYALVDSCHPDKKRRFDLLENLNLARGDDKDSSVASPGSVLLREGKAP